MNFRRRACRRSRRDGVRRRRSARPSKPPGMPRSRLLFGEDQARYIVATEPDKTGAILAAAQNAGVACERLGETGGQTLTLGGETAILLSDLVGNFEDWLPDYMAGAAYPGGSGAASARSATRQSEERPQWPWKSSEIERLIKAGIPDAKIDLTDLVGDKDHWSATVISVRIRRQDQVAAASDRLQGARRPYGRSAARPAAHDAGARIKSTEFAGRCAGQTVERIRIWRSRKRFSRRSTPTMSFCS